MKKTRPAWLYAIVFGIVAFGLYKLGQLAPDGSAIHNIMEGLAFACGFIGACLIFLNYTKDGRRQKALFGPSGAEERYWDPNTGKRRHSGADSLRATDQGGGDGPLEMVRREGKWVLWVFIALSAVFILWTLANPENVLQDYAQDSKAVEDIFDGVIHGNTEQLSEGGRLLLQSMGRDLILFLRVFAVIIVVVLIAVFIRKRRVKKERYHYEEDE